MRTMEAVTGFYAPDMTDDVFRSVLYGHRTLRKRYETGTDMTEGS